MTAYLEPLLALPDRTWSAYLATQDFYARHFTPENYQTILAAGEQLAAQCMKQLFPAGIAGKSLFCSDLPFPVVVRPAADEAFANPSILNFGQYWNGEILISDNGAAFLEQIWEKYDLHQRLDFRLSAGELIFAHELFHHWYDWEGERQGETSAIRCGPFRRYIIPDCTEEIAAHLFSRQAANLPCHPYLLHLLVMREEGLCDMEKVMAALTNAGKYLL